MQTTKKITRKHRPDLFLLLFMGLLMLIGLIVIYAIGPQRVNAIYGPKYSQQYFFINQLVSVGLSLVAFFIAAKVIPISFMKKYAKYLLIGGLAACIILAIAAALNIEAIAECTYGACRWIKIGTRTIQPAEILKLGLLLYLAVFLGERSKQGKIDSWNDTLLPLAIMSGVALFFVVVAQRDLGTGVAIFAIIFSMLIISGMSKKILLAVCGIFVVAGLILTISVPHRRDRLLTFLKGDETSVDDSSTYHITHAKIAIGVGGLFGVGIGSSVQATGYLPESINDSIFAIMGETFGFVGLVVIIGLFVILLMRLLREVYYLHDSTSRLIVAGVFGWMSAHVIINIAAMVGIIPLTGITLPFLSYGGTSMIFFAAAFGIAFQLSSYTAHTGAEENNNENIDSRRRVGRTRHSSIKRNSRA